jgi:hypothetical protein
MFSQVTKTSAIQKHAIRQEIFRNWETLARFQGFLFFLLEHDPNFRPDALSLYNELSLTSSITTSDTSPIN